MSCAHLNAAEVAHLLGFATTALHSLEDAIDDVAERELDDPTFALYGKLCYAQDHVRVVRKRLERLLGK